LLGVDLISIIRVIPREPFRSALLLVL
jgi:hypothetical protein